MWPYFGRNSSGHLENYKKYTYIILVSNDIDVLGTIVYRNFLKRTWRLTTWRVS